MDEQSRKMLDEILAQDPLALSDNDKGFLRARRSYLSEEQKSVYAEILAEQPEASSESQKAKAPKAKKLKLRKPRSQNSFSS